MPIRVAMVVNNLDVGGLEKVVLSLLSSLDPVRFEPHLVCLKGEGKLFGDVALPPERRLVLRHERVVNLGVARMDPGALWEMGRFFRERRVDVVHAHNFGPLIYGGLSARIGGRPGSRPRVVYSEHNQVNSASERDLQKFRWYVRLADRVVNVSEDLQRTLGGKLGVRVPMQVVHNGIDGRRFEGVSGEAVRRELGLAPDDVVFGTAVVLSKQKGIPHLLDAIPSVLAAVPRARFVVAGDGPLRAELEAAARAKGLEGRVLFPGYRRDVPQLLSAFDVYVLPSLWEGLPLALLEAMALGRPIVCTSVGGNPEIVRDGENGLVVPPADPGALAAALSRVGNDEALRAAMRSRNTERFRDHFSLASMTRAHEALYERLV